MSNVTDLSPLAKCGDLNDLTLPPDSKNFDFLRKFPKLERIGFGEDPNIGHRPDKTVAEFWKEHDANDKKVSGGIMTRRLMPESLSDVHQVQTVCPSLSRNQISGWNFFVVLR